MRPYCTRKEIWSAKKKKINNSLAVKIIYCIITFAKKQLQY